MTNHYPNKMKAVVAYAPKHYRFEEVNTPVIDHEEEIIMKGQARGICAGDIEAYDGAPSFWGDETQPAYIKAPMLPCHVFVGHVVDKGEAVPDFESGDRIISAQIVPCWDCRF